MIPSHFLIALRVMIIAPLKIYVLLVLSFRVHFACVFINGGQQLKKKKALNPFPQLATAAYINMSRKDRCFPASL